MGEKTAQKGWVRLGGEMIFWGTLLTVAWPLERGFYCAAVVWRKGKSTFKAVSGEDRLKFALRQAFYFRGQGRDPESHCSHI